MYYTNGVGYICQAHVVLQATCLAMVSQVLSVLGFGRLFADPLVMFLGPLWTCYRSFEDLTKLVKCDLGCNDFEDLVSVFVCVCVCVCVCVRVFVFKTNMCVYYNCDFVRAYFVYVLQECVW